MENYVPFVDIGDLVLVTESLSVPTAVSADYVPLKADVPEGTMGVITADKGGGVYSVITGLGLIQVHTDYLTRLGRALPDYMTPDY